MTSAESLDHLLALLLDVDPDFDESIALADELAACGDLSLVPAVEAALEEALAAGEFFARDLIAGVLAGLNGPDALPVLLRASARDLGDDQDSLLAEVVDLFAQYPGAARAAALPLVEEPDARLRAVGVWTLGFASGPQDVELFARTAADESGEVRGATAGALGSHAAGLPKAVDLLIALLADPEPQVRIDALAALGESRQARALQAVRTLAEDPDEGVRRWAVISADRLTPYQ
ncbi:HEAT repeat domain-containing protein [Kitasatospora sp. NPDC101183]|uniref:HEAT repeat domain-containing protein n=1 Tax=Kitasatospora sp. NPDC101183 TaxID=3364100 RepID=UPI0037F697AF